jgi:hypothetical protein
VVRVEDGEVILIKSGLIGMLSRRCPSSTRQAGIHNLMAWVVEVKVRKERVLEEE